MSLTLHAFANQKLLFFALLSKNSLTCVFLSDKLQISGQNFYLTFFGNGEHETMTKGASVLQIEMILICCVGMHMGFFYTAMISKITRTEILHKYYTKEEIESDKLDFVNWRNRDYLELNNGRRLPQSDYYYFVAKRGSLFPSMVIGYLLVLITYYLFLKPCFLRIVAKHKATKTIRKRIKRRVKKR